MCPTIVLDNQGRTEMVIGGAGGTKITTAVAQNFIRKFYQGLSLGHAVADPRLHHQLLPMKAQYQNDYDTAILSSLEKIGHETSSYSYTSSFAPAIFVNFENGTIEAKGDNRKANNEPAGI